MLDRLGQPPDCVLDIESALVVGPSKAEFHSWEVGGPDVLGAIQMATEREGTQRREGVDGEGEAGLLRDVVGAAGDGYGELGRGEDCG